MRTETTRSRVIPLPPSAPRWGNGFTRAVGRLLLGFYGWRVEGAVPDIPKLVAIAAPHTCTIDVFVAVGTLLSMGLRLRFMGKHTIFWEPLGSVMRWIGAIPVDRGAPGGLVGQVVSLINSSDQLYLGLAPEGTRRKVERWKTGFYRIALEARVPIVPVTLDYRRRVVHVGEPLMPTGDYDKDLAALQSHFCAEMARHPERY